MFLITIFPLRKGQKLVFWAYGHPFSLYGFPMLYLDAMNVAETHLATILMPQVAGIGLASVGLMLVAPLIFRRQDV
jgi:hypothetical protein